MKLQHFDILGVGRAMKIRLVISDEAAVDASTQWVEATLEVPVVGVMDEDAIRVTAMTYLRDLLNVEIAGLRSGPLG
jgi:hypothetical protein